MINKDLEMKKHSFILLVFLSGFIKSQTFIQEPIYSLGMDEMHILKQSNDTLYNYTSYSVKPFQIELRKNREKIRRHYKIWDNQNLDENYFALKLERLDTLQMTTDKYPENRFLIWIYKKSDESEFTLLNGITKLNKEQALAYQFDTIDYKNYVGFTSYGLSKIKEFLKLKKLRTEEDVEIIKNHLETNQVKYKSVVKAYEENSKLPDMYGQGLLATILNMAYLELGYCPVGASIVMNNILDSSTIPYEEKQQMVNEFYQQLNPE